MKQRAQTSEAVASGGGEVERTEVATEEDLNLPEPSLAAGFRGKSEKSNKKTSFEAIGTESEKVASPTQLLSNPRKSDSVQQTKDNFMGLVSQKDPTDIMESLESQSKVQIFQGEDSQSRGLASLGCGSEQATPDELNKGAKEEKSKTIKIGVGLGPLSEGNYSKTTSEMLGKIGIGPGPLGEVKKGQWIRLKNRPNSELREEFMHGIEAPKHKAGELEGSEEFFAEKVKKQKTKEETKKISVLFATHLRSAEVVEQPHRSQ